MEKELTNHPEHYGGEGNPYEAIRVIEAMGWGEGFCMGSALKYLLREGRKDGEPAERDLGKARWFVDRRIYEIENGIDGRMDVEKAREIVGEMFGIKSIKMGDNQISCGTGSEGFHLDSEILEAVFPKSKDIIRDVLGDAESSAKIMPIKTISEILGYKEPIYNVIVNNGTDIIMEENIPMSFGGALDAMKADNSRMFARKGWNGKGIFIQVQIPDENSRMTQPYIFIDTTHLDTDNPNAVKGRVPWLASQTDMLADDWVEIKIVEV